MVEIDKTTAKIDFVTKRQSKRARLGKGGYDSEKAFRVL